MIILFTVLSLIGLIGIPVCFAGQLSDDDYLEEWTFLGIASVILLVASFYTLVFLNS